MGWWFLYVDVITRDEFPHCAFSLPNSACNIKIQATEFVDYENLLFLNICEAWKGQAWGVRHGVKREVSRGDAT